MLLIDEADWPLVLLRWEPPMGEMDLDLYRARLEGWLARGRPFAILSFQPVEPRPESLHRVIHGPFWTPELRRLAAQSCAGIACVISGVLGPDLTGGCDLDELRRIMGCPIDCFDDGDMALRWARARLAGFTPANAQAGAPVRALSSGSPA